MPRAKTGCNFVLYTLVTKESLERLNAMVEKVGCGRPLFMDNLIKRASRQPLPKIKRPEYTPHKRIPRKILKTTSARA